MPVVLKCARCRKSFSVPPSTAKRGRRYCRMACKTADGPHNEKHGASRSRLYTIWCSMKHRCSPTATQENAKEYYAGQVKVCDEWANDFRVFRDWAMANGYSPGLEIDRKEATGNYEPGNCRWATRIQQMANTRKRRGAKNSSRFKGVSKHAHNAGRWVALITNNRVTTYLGSFGSALLAARAYDVAAFRTRGEYARVNFPESFKSRRASIAGVNEKT